MCLAGWLAWSRNISLPPVVFVDVVPFFSLGTITRNEGKQWWNQLTWSGDGTDVSWLNIQYPDVTVLGYDKQAWNIQNGSYRSHPNPFSSIRRLLLSIVDFRNHKCVGIFYEYFTPKTFIASQGWCGRKCRSDQIWINVFRIAFQCPTWSRPWLLLLLSCRAVLSLVHFYPQAPKNRPQMSNSFASTFALCYEVSSVFTKVFLHAYRFKPSMKEISCDWL